MSVKERERDGPRDMTGDATTVDVGPLPPREPRDTILPVRFSVGEIAAIDEAVEIARKVDPEVDRSKLVRRWVRIAAAEVLSRFGAVRP